MFILKSSCCSLKSVSFHLSISSDFASNSSKTRFNDSHSLSCSRDTNGVVLYSGKDVIWSLSDAIQTGAVVIINLIVTWVDQNYMIPNRFVWNHTKGSLFIFFIIFKRNLSEIEFDGLDFNPRMELKQNVALFCFFLQDCLVQSSKELSYVLSGLSIILCSSSQGRFPYPF